ncbi:MAG: DUF4185 domain-containing protein, partial [Candidatus Latescibacterota bacterium]
IIRTLIGENDYLDAQTRIDYFLLLAREAWEMHQHSLAGDVVGLALYAGNLLPLLDLVDLFGGGDRTEIHKLRDEIMPVAFSLIDQAVANRDTTILKTLDIMTDYMKDGWKNRVVEAQVVAKLYRDAIALCQETRSPDDPYLNQRLEKFAHYLERVGRRALAEDHVSDAVPALREALQLRSQAHSRRDIYAVTQALLGESLTKLGRYSEAEPLLLESLEVLNSRDGRLLVIELYESWGKPDKAEHVRRDLLVESVREVGPILMPETHYMQRCSSGEFEGRSIWVSWTRDGRWAWTDDLIARDGIRLYYPATDSLGGQRELLRLTADERAYNDVHSAVDQMAWRLVPKAVIGDPDRQRALIVYEKILEGPDRKHERAGCSLAVWEHPDSAVVRPLVRPESEEPTLLFQGDDPQLDAGALVDGGFLYLYSANFTSCAVARAPLADVLNRDAWRFYAKDGKWAKDATLAAAVLPGTVAIVSVHWNEHLDKYLAVHGNFGKRGIHVRTADRPEGPWSPPRQILEGLPTEKWANHGLVAHPEFARDGGRIEYMTYNHPTGPWKREIRLVEVTFK